ncbi:hypothetical protein MNBD_BACTEROID06-1860 [hydrothermal vent metagenome]|uniref:Uncharacterized protein n=1 Tax=hydrothermal vent metagenome TaxID=652676 RepID=A0A3B0UIC3_9ZZZZ
MRIELYMVFLIAFATSFVYGQNDYSVERIEQLDIKGFNLKLNPEGDKLVYTTSNYKGLWLYNIGEGNTVEISSKNGAGYEPLITDDYIFYKSKESQSMLQRIEVLSKNKTSINLSSKEQSPKAFYACEGTSKILEAKTSSDLYSIVLIYRDGRQIEIAPLGKRNYLNVSLSPNETKLLFRVSGLGSYVTQLDGTVIKEFKTAEFPVWLNENEILFAEVNDDGHQYVASDLYISSISSNEKLNLTSSIDAIAIYPNVSANKRKIVFNTPEGHVYLISLGFVTK